MSTEERTIVLSALLHDVGKLGERAATSDLAKSLQTEFASPFQHEPFAVKLIESLGASWEGEKATMLRLISNHHRATVAGS